MERKFFVECEEQCPDCKGAGEIETWEWVKFGEAWKEHEQKELHPEGIFAGDSETGETWHYEFERLAAAWIGPNWRKVPEFYRCENCEGTGTWRHRVPLAEALGALGVLPTDKEEAGVEPPDVGLPPLCSCTDGFAEPEPDCGACAGTGELSRDQLRLRQEGHDE